MSDREQLRDFAQRHGIAGEYWDVRGTQHVTSDETDRALLTALGVSVDDEPGWGYGVTPGSVVPVDAAGEVSLVATRQHASDTHYWTLQGPGLAAQGEVIPAQLIWAEDGPDGRLRYRWQLPPLPQTGYYTVTVRSPTGTTDSLVVARPERCFVDGTEARRWGASLQLYALRSRRNWGIGDFTDLTVAVNCLAALGADAVGINPLHLLFLDDPDQASPYSPSSRRWLNPLYLDVTAVPEVIASARTQQWMASAPVQARLASLRATNHVDYPTVAALKREALARAFDDWRRDGDPVREANLTAFRDRHGEALTHVAIFGALRESEFGPDPSHWPAELRDPQSDAVIAFAAANAVAVSFHAYLQWLADEQLAAVAARARHVGMSIGLYGDLALGSSAGGSDVWAASDAYAIGVSIGAPPDDLSPDGQSWGLPPLRPTTLTGDGIDEFRAALQAAMRHMGAIRLDHVMGLQRLFWVPEGGNVDGGAYVDYPFDTLMATVAVESVANDCLVVGEDLGTVPPELRQTLHAAGVLTYRVVWFERRWDGDRAFLTPSEYPTQALATVSTHDLATIAGYVRGTDLEHRDRIAGGRNDEAHNVRADDVVALRSMLASTAGLSADEPNERLVRDALHRFVAATPCALAMVQMDDVFDEIEQANLPGTITEHPNWRRKLRVPVEEWASSPEFAALREAMQTRRHP